MTVKTAQVELVEVRMKSNIQIAKIAFFIRVDLK